MKHNARILDIDALKRIVDKGLRLRFFYYKEINILTLSANLRSWIPNIEFKQMGEIDFYSTPGI